MEHRDNKEPGDQKDTVKTVIIPASTNKIYLNKKAQHHVRSSLK